MVGVQFGKRPLEHPLPIPELAALERQLRGDDPVVERRHDDRDTPVVDNAFVEEQVLLAAVPPDGRPHRRRRVPIDDPAGSGRRGCGQGGSPEQLSARQGFAHTVIRAPPSPEIARRQSVTFSCTWARPLPKRTFAMPSMIEYSFVAFQTQRYRRDGRAAHVASIPCLPSAYAGFFIIGKCFSTALITARTAAMRDGGQSNDAAAGGATTSASRVAPTATLLTFTMLLAAGCGGSSQPGFRDPERLATAVRRSVEQRLMTQEPRQGSTHAATHLERVRCEHVVGDRYVCRGVFGDGFKVDLDVVVSENGKEFRLR
jgi:hypothetical protein